MATTAGRNSASARRPNSSRAGNFVKQPTGYAAFIPRPLPPEPPLTSDDATVALLAQANLELGRLDGVTRTLPNPDLFVAMYVRREAVLSSQIEGTQSTLDDVLAYELNPSVGELPRDVEEIVNYVKAMNHGLHRIESLPLSLRLIREIHGHLMRNVRGKDRDPGQFRTTQNWIGPHLVPLERATFVPPPPKAMTDALSDFEKFLHNEHLDPLILCGLAHAQFETIHPFLDGNGRVGRLLVTFLLVHRNVLHRPLLYLSYFLKLHHAEYYDRLMDVRLHGDWEGWMRFFLRGIAETAVDAVTTATAIVGLRESHRELVQSTRPFGLNGLRLLDLLYERPLVNVGLVRDRLGLAFVTAAKLVEGFQAAGLLDETTGKRRGRVFRYSPYLALFAEPAQSDGGTGTAAVQETEAAPEQPLASD